MHRLSPQVLRHPSKTFRIPEVRPPRSTSSPRAISSASAQPLSTRASSPASVERAHRPRRSHSPSTVTTSRPRHLSTPLRTTAAFALVAATSLSAVLVSSPHLAHQFARPTSRMGSLTSSTIARLPRIAYAASPFSTSSYNGSSSSSSDAKMGSNGSKNPGAELPKGKSEQEWRTVLSPQQFRILREKGTEMAGTGEYDKHYPSNGVYNCAGCDTPLYKSATKFKSGCGWPAFFDAIPGAVERHVDRSFGMKRIEITCKACGGHLGHVFEGEGFPTPTDERHCVNSISLRFDADGDGKL